MPRSKLYVLTLAGRWRVRHGCVLYGPFQTLRDAFDKAHDLARSLVMDGCEVRIMLEAGLGRFRLVWISSNPRSGGPRGVGAGAPGLASRRTPAARRERRNLPRPARQ